MNVGRDQFLCHKNADIKMSHSGYSPPFKKRFIFLSFVNKSFKWAEKCNYVGNGGLSLRKKSKMLELIHNIDIHIDENEDLFFSTNQEGVRKPDYEIAKQFSIETVFSDITFGCHAPWKWIDTQLLYSVYPEVKQLVELQGVA